MLRANSINAPEMTGRANIAAIQEKSIVVADQISSAQGSDISVMGRLFKGIKPALGLFCIFLSCLVGLVIFPAVMEMLDKQRQAVY